MSFQGKVVIKLGSSTLTDSNSRIDYSFMQSIADQIAAVKQAGWQPIIVSSGAIACGLEALGITKRPSDLPSLQAAASVGQNALSAAYARAFSRHGIVTSLVLLTRRDTADRTAYLHARDTFGRLLELGVVPVVNENDTVSVEQIKFGDNDTLAALVACLVGADKVIIMSDIDGLYEDDPKQNPDAAFIDEVAEITDDLTEMGKEAPGSNVGTGGMSAKIVAARMATDAGIDMVITNGDDVENIYRVLDGEKIGTLFLAHKNRNFDLIEYLTAY